MSALNAWLKKYGGATTQPAQTDQDNQKNALSAWLEKYNNFTPSGADTVQPPAGTEAVVPSIQPNGYKSQNAAHLSSGLSRDDFDSSVRNRNQLRALEDSRAQDTRDKVATHMVMTGSRELPALSEIEKISPFTKGETMSFENGNGEQKDFTIPYFDYESNKPNTVIQAEGYLKSTGETLKKLQSDIENNSARLQYYESSVNKYVDELERLAARVQSNPTAAGYAAYNSLYEKYQKAYSEYETFISEHNAKISLYNDYTQRYETAAADVRKYNEQWDAANLDFFEKSKIGLQNFYDTKETEKQAHREAENEKPWWQKILDANAKSYTITNENPAVYAANAVVENYRNDTSYKEPSDEWTDGQKNIFGYLWAVDKEKASEFAITVNESIAEEKEGKTSKKIKDWVTQNLGTGILGTAGALLLSPTAIADVTDNLAEYVARGRITKKGALSPFDVSQAITGGITEELNETYGTIDEKVPVVGGKGLGDLYQLGYSMAQSMTVGKISKLAGNSAFTYATFFGQGAASGIDKQLDAGGTAGQAICYGLVVGAAEAVFEEMGIESLFKEGNGSLLKEMLKQGGVESLEEGLTSVVDFVADTLIMMDKSAVFKATEEYSKIMSEDKAKLTALMDVLEGIAYDALGGLITGGADTAILAGANKVGQAVDIEKQKRHQEQTIKNADAVIGSYAEAVQKYGENSPQAMELKSKAERAYIEKVRANLRLGMLNGKSTTVTTQERSEEEITQLVTQAQAAGDATAETGYYAGASDQLIRFAQQEKAILKQLTGRDVDIRFYQADVGENGHYDPGTGTIYVNVNSAQPFSYIEGHEFTHELENSAGYAEYAEWVKTEGLGAMYNTYKENIKRRYESRGINLTELDLEQEVVATWTGENLFTDDTTMKKLIKKLSDGKPTLARKIFGGIRRFVSRSRSGITRNHYERALYLYQQMAQGKASAVSSAQTVNENAPTSFPAETAKVPQKQKNTAEAVNTAENDIMISNGEVVAQDNGKFANDSEFTPAVRELVDRIADTARQIEASDQKGADYRRLKKEQKANLRALEQLRREGKIDSVEYNRAIETLRDTTESPEYGGIEESKANLQAQYEAGNITLEEYEDGMAELEEVGAEESSPSKIKYSLSETIAPTRKELESKNPIKVVNVKVGLESESYADMKVAAKNKATNEGWFDIPHHNVDTDSFIFLTEKSFTHAFSNLRSDFGEDTIRCMAHIPEIIQEAVLVSVDNPKDNRKAETKVYTFFGAIDGVNGVEPVKLTVKEFDFRSLDAVPKNIRNYFEKNGISEKYNSLYDTHALEVIGIEGIQKESDASGRVGEQSSRAQATSDSIISIADLLNLVKGKAEKYIPKYSFEDLDNEYLDAVNSGDMETARRLVEEAARKAGYTDRVYHGTQQFGFTEFDAKYSDDKISFFAAGSPDLAQTYSGIPKVREVSDKSYDSESTNGNYALYAKPGNQLVIDGNGRNWSDIRYWSRAFEKTKDSTYVQKSDGYYVLIDRNTGEEISDGEIAINAYTERLGLSQLHAVMLDKVNEMFRIRTENLNTTRDVVRYAKKLGYDSVKFENIRDDGGRGVSVQEPQDIYAYFNPNDLKSADTVTYDEDGNVIPLSERFNSEKTDIRFSLEEPTREDVISELRQYMNGARSKDQIRDVIARVKKNPQSEIYGGSARRPQYSEGVQRILDEAERDGMSVRDYISQNIDEFEVRGKLTEDARKALEISGDYRKFSVEDVRASRPPRSIEELDRILAEAEPLDPNEFRKTDFDRWYERREKEDQLREKMAELVMKAPDENEINTTLEELASDLENGYITPDAALEVVEGLREETDGARVKYSLEEYTEHQKKNWANSKRIVIYENDAQFTQFIENSVSDKTFDKKMYFGAISPELARRIQNDTGINVEHYNLSLSSNEIRKILKKHGNAESEALSGQRAVTTDDFLHILDVVLNPDNIKLSDQTYAGKPVIIFTGTHNGQMNIVAVVSDKRLDLFVQTVYVNTKRGTLATPIGETFLYHTPEANSGTDSSARIVPQDPDVVKPAVKKSVEDIDILEADTVETLQAELEKATSERDAIMAEAEKLMAEVNQGSVSLEDYTAKIAESGQRYEELQNKIDRLTQQIEATSITEKAIGDPLQSEPLKQLVTTLGKRLNLKKVEKQALRSLIQDFATGEYATKDELYKAVKKGFDTFYYTERNELIAEIKATIRDMPIKVSDAIKFDAGWTSDGYGKFVKSNFGKLRFSNNGRGVDSVYSELNSLYPAYFPDDIINESDMLQEISRVASLPINQVRAEPLGDETMQDITDYIYESVLEYRESERADEERVRIQNEQEAIEAQQRLTSLQNKALRFENRFKLTEEDKALALEILCGDKSISEIDNVSNKEQLLEYIAVLNEAEVVAKGWKKWQNERRSRWQKEADEMFKTFDSSVKGGFKYDKKGNIKTDKRGNPKFQEEATNKAGYKYVRETQTRITYDIFAEDKHSEAKAFNDWLFEPERASEAQSNRYKNKMRDQVRALKLGTKIQKGNAVSESAAVQILGELQDIIRRTKRQADMGNADTYRVNGLTYNEAVWSLAELKKQNPNMDFSENGKIQKAVEKFGQLYAEMLSDMNQTLVRNGYPPVPARSGYFPHFADEGDTLIRRIGRALGIDTDVSVLPTGINGLTHTFKPGKTWFANALERKGHKTAYDAVLGFDKYIEGAANVIFHTDNIQRQRYFARAIRYNASDEAIKAKIDEITANDTLNEDEKDLQIQYVTSRTKFRHSTYVVQLEDHTNSLAGKKTFSDRDMERLMGRKAYTWMKNIEGRVAANMIAGNMSSALSNFIPLQYCEAEIGLGYTLQAMGQTIKSFFGDDGFKDRSDFLTNRYGSEFLVKSGMDKISEKLSVPMEAIDHFTAQVLVRAAYNKYLKKGASPELAMERANSFAAEVMADRSRGALPEIFNNKNPLYKSFTMFQVEVNNNLSHIFKDIPRENRDKWWSAVLGILAKLFFGIWIFNETSEKLVGRRMAGTDVIDAANDVIGDLSGYQLPNTWDLIEAIIKGEDIGAMFETNKVSAGQAILNLGGTAAEDLPFVSSFLGGGDLPVGSAMPDLSKLLPLLDSDKDTENVKQTVYEELLKPVSYAVLPFGANQLSKTAKGHQALREGGSYKTNSKGEEILQYPIYAENKGEAIWNFIKATVFGKSSFPGAREWVENDFKSLSARGTAAYKGMIAAGVPEKDAYDLVIDIASVSPSDQEIMEQVISMGGVDRVFSETVSNGPTSAELKCEIIRNADISGEGKAILYFSMIANESECNFMSSMQEAGADMGAVVAELLDTSAKSSDRKYAAIMSSGLPEAEQLWQIYLLDTSAEKSTHKRYYVASDTFGISPNEYRVAKDFVTEHLNGASLSNMRVEEAIREYAKTVPLTKIEKAALWQIILGRDSAKNNPFDVSTGEKVVRAMANYDEEERAFYEKYGPKPTN
ncbi:MAG: hypothetical protein IJC32_00940 [Clostridia bacterium]|nr:hypothetical protein [Clostridia bacterium]